MLRGDRWRVWSISKLIVIYTAHPPWEASLSALLKGVLNYQIGEDLEKSLAAFCTERLSTQDFQDDIYLTQIKQHRPYFSLFCPMALCWPWSDRDHQQQGHLQPSRRCWMLSFEIMKQILHLLMSKWASVGVSLINFVLLAASMLASETVLLYESTFDV